MRSLTRVDYLSTIFVMAAFCAAPVMFAAETQPPKCARDPAEIMNNIRLDCIIRNIDAEAEGQSGFWRFTVAERALLVIGDDNSKRMRILTGVIEVQDLEEQRLTRLTQANFDSAVDARYAIARGVLWSPFLHPLSTLDERDFI